MKETAERRLARLLLRVTRDRKGPGMIRLLFDLSNRELANAVGTTRWHISYFMSFQRLGLMRRHDGLWVDRQKLDDYLKAA